MALAPKNKHGRLDIEKPKWKQDSFAGRAKHFFTITDPRNLFVSNEQLEAARILVTEYKLGIEPKRTTDEQVWKAKVLYDFAFHPATGEKQILLGRMSTQVPMSMLIMGGMLTFYKTVPGVIFWQWFNQSYMAIVNYTNRSGDTPIPNGTLVKAYVSATGAALSVSLGLNAVSARLPSLVGRFVPFTAIVAANCVNIPLMRQKELRDGISIADENGDVLGTSKYAARNAIQMTIFSRIIMALPAMTIPPITMEYLKNKGVFDRAPKMAAPVVQVGLIGVLFVFATPLCCAIFPQISSMRLSDLETEVYTSIRKKNENIKMVYFNKGL